MFNLNKHASDPWITVKKRLYVMYVNPPEKQPQGTIRYIHKQSILFFKTRLTDYAKGYLNLEGIGTFLSGKL